MKCLRFEMSITNGDSFEAILMVLRMCGEQLVLVLYSVVLEAFHAARNR